MLLRDMKHHDLQLGTFQRPDGERFQIKARLYEMPAEYDYWQVPFDVHHDQWGNMRFVLTIPKKIASSIELAEVFVSGSALEQVKASLATANEKGRDFSVCFGVNGWTLI